MLPKFFISVFLFTFLMEKGCCICSNNESLILSNCYNNYFTTLGAGYLDYFDILDNYIYTATGVDTLCQYYSALQKCLGNTIVEDCINFDGFHQTFGGQNSYAMTSNFFKLEFMCGNGKAAYENSLSCFLILTTNCDEKIATCSDAVKDINCWANAAKNSCGQDAYYFMYNYLSIEYCYDDLQCNTCINGVHSSTTQKVVSTTPGHNSAYILQYSMLLYFFALVLLIFYNLF